MSNINYRVAGPADIQEVASLHTRSWRDAYRGILPDAYLEGPIAEERAKFWQVRLSSPGDERRYIVLAETESRPVAFVCALLGEDSLWGACLDNLHVLPEFKGKGLGRQLFLRAAQWVISTAPGWPIHLWVFEANYPARRFYEALGGDVVERLLRTAPGGVDIPSLRYVWRDPRRLATLLT